ncbi:MAG: hypothetical protein CMJ74_11360 [Planctomycetaceae bacterium]|nr:hypothetical protein [Planctomycetaceae bacterium]|tara:strand:- start:197 stop:1120 length:924 start_codon:yes stop_codon:yes gene_type:complete
MNSPQGYLGGRLIPVSEMAIPVTDAGFSLGTTVTEQLRTFSGEIFELDRHLQRLKRSLEIVGVKPVESLSEISEIAQSIVQNNYPLLAPGDDLGLTLFVTAGNLPRFQNGKRSDPCLGMHTFPLPFQLWREKYVRGQSLVVTEIEQVATQCWPAELKCRSRMHYFLADQSASRIAPGSRALLLNADGHVIETTTANIILYKRNQGLVTPPREIALPGISLLYVQALAKELGVDWNYRVILPEEVAQADEVLLSSTPFCLLPVTSFNGIPIKDGYPGPLFTQLVQAWSVRIGVEIVAQANRFAERNGV